MTEPRRVRTLDDALALMEQDVRLTMQEQAFGLFHHLTGDAGWDDASATAAARALIVDSEAGLIQAKADLRSRWPMLVAALNRATDARGGESTTS